MIAEFVRGVSGFHNLNQREQIKLFAWYLHRRANMETFSTEDITGCFDAADVHRPSNTSQRLIDLVGKKHLIKRGNGYKLALGPQQAFDKQFGARQQTAEVDALLASLPSKLSTPGETDYLEEALRCFRAKAFRGAVIMTWNVCYHHLTQHVFEKQLAVFNAHVTLKKQQNAKYAMTPVAVHEDFQWWGEREVIDICKATGIVSREIGKVLVEKLDKRNSAAHPSGSKFDNLQAEAYVADLIQNAMLKIA